MIDITCIIHRMRQQKNVSMDSINRISPSTHLFTYARTYVISNRGDINMSPRSANCSLYRVTSVFNIIWEQFLLHTSRNYEWLITSSSGVKNITATWIKQALVLQTGRTWQIKRRHKHWNMARLFSTEWDFRGKNASEMRPSHGLKEIELVCI